MKEVGLIRLATLAEIARILGVPLRRVEYVLRSRPHIHPHAVAGSARCYDDAAIVRIQEALNAIDAHRGGKGVAHDAN